MPDDGTASLTASWRLPSSRPCTESIKGDSSASFPQSFDLHLTSSFSINSFSSHITSSTTTASIAFDNMLASKAFAILALFAAVGTLASPVPTESKSSDVSTDGLDDLDEVPVPGGQLSDSLSLDDPTVSLKTQKYSTSQSGTIDYKLKMASYGTGGYIGAW